MKLLHKRILILFSLALNVGFLIVAVPLFYTHSRPHDDRFQDEIAGVVKSLDLSPAVSRAVMDNINQFKTAFDELDDGIRKIRKDMEYLIQQRGPLDRDRLHELVLEDDELRKRKGEVFENHVVDLRRILGDEKGALYFIQLRRVLKPYHKDSHR